MAYSRFLLLLIGVIASHLPEVQGRPSDFWCNNQSRESMRDGIERLKNMTNCVGSDTLPFPVRVPCVRLNLEQWTNKTLQHKRAELVKNLQDFHIAVQGANRNNTCWTSVLKGLEHQIRNYLTIVNRLPIQNDAVAPSPPAVPHCSKHISKLSILLGRYTKLLEGKLMLLATDLHDSICKEEHVTTNTKGR